MNIADQIKRILITASVTALFCNSVHCEEKTARQAFVVQVPGSVTLTDIGGSSHSAERQIRIQSSVDVAVSVHSESHAATDMAGAGLLMTLANGDTSILYVSTSDSSSLARRPSIQGRQRLTVPCDQRTVLTISGI